MILGHNITSQEMYISASFNWAHNLRWMLTHDHVCVFVCVCVCGE